MNKISDHRGSVTIPFGITRKYKSYIIGYPPPTSSGFESSSIFETFLFSLHFHQNTSHYSNLFQETTMAKPPIRQTPKPQTTGFSS